MSLPTGARVGPYEIIATLGAGGMGEVYRARDPKLARDVAIKVLPDALASDGERLARLAREAQTLAALNHPNIAAIYGMEAVGSGHALVMELVEGDDLSVHIARGPMAIAEAVAAARQIADALEAAHERGIVHRDLKPANVKVRADGVVKVLDFGLAKAMDTVSAPGVDLAKSPTLTARATQMGMIIGTAAYMSPEQAKGKAVDKRADIWAFAVVLHEMLTGRPLFEAETVSETLAAVLRQDIDTALLPAGTPVAVRHLIARCLDRDPRTRLRDIGEARVVLSAPLTDRPATAVIQPASPRARWLPGLVGLAAGLAVAVGVWAGLGRASAPAADDRPPAVTFRRLTEVPGPERQPDISPDGRQILYTSSVTGRRQVYLLRVGGGRAINLGADSGDDEQARFSPSGEQIVFRSSRDGGGLFLMGATGESVRRLTQGGFDPAWSHDGRFIAFATEAVDDPYSRLANSELWTVEVATGKTTKLYAGDGIQPAWSPDDTRIAFWGNTGGQRDLWTIAATGGDARAVTNDAFTDWSPAWSPDGRWLYFGTDRGGGMNVWRLPIDVRTGGARGEPQPVTSGVRALGYGRFSSDGTRMVAMAYDRSFDITVADFDPANPERIVPRTTLRNQSFGRCGPSPDGGWLACQSLGKQEDVLVLRSDGTDTRRLTDDAFKDRLPRWSPDGKTLAFFSNRSGGWETWAMQADGAGLRQITNLDVRGALIWSPDGKRGVVFSNTTKKNFLIDPSRLNTADTVEPLPEQANFTFVFAWSPGGTLLAGRSRTDAEFGSPAVWDLTTKTLRTIAAAGANRPLASRFARGNSWMSFLPDSRRLLVNSQTGLMLVDLADGSSRRIRAGDEGDNYLLSRDGRTLMMEREVLDSDIWLLELGKSGQ